MALQFRLQRDDDLEAIRKLWTENTDWGTDVDAIFNHYIGNSCLDGACVLLAIDDDTCNPVGMFAFLPYLVQAGSRIIKAYRPAAPVVSKKYRYFRANPLDHPAIRMYNEGAKLMQKRGDDLIFMVPNPSWIRLLRMFPQLRTGSFPLFTRSITNPSIPEADAGVSWKKVSLQDGRIDQLWERFRKLHNCGVVRNQNILEWKLGRGEHEVVGVERAGELVALVAMRLKGHRQWLIDDLLVADLHLSLRDAMVAALHSAQTATEESAAEIDKVGLLATPAMQDTLQNLGFSRDQYNFPLVVHTLSEGLMPEEVDPKHWFLSAND